MQYHIKGVVHTKNITIPQGHYDPASYMKEVNKEIKKIKHKFTATSEPKVLLKGRLKYNPTFRKITLVLNNHLEAMTFYGDNFRNCILDKNIIMNFQNRAPLIIRVLTCMCTPAW